MTPLNRPALSRRSLGQMVFVNRKSGAIPIHSECHWHDRRCVPSLMVWPFDNGSLGDALLMKDSSPSFAISDAVFMILCGGLVFLGFRWVNSKEGGASSFLRGLFINDTWSSLTNPVLGGWSKTGGAWCLLVGVLFYMYWGVRYTRWIDPGVYVVTIALLASGIALKGVSQVTPQES